MRQEVRDFIEKGAIEWVLLGELKSRFYSHYTLWCPNGAEGFD